MTLKIAKTPLAFQMAELESLLNYKFKDPDLAEMAFTHKSFHNENPTTSKGHNEVLEFLGDAVLDLVLAELLIIQFPQAPEGDLSKIRASFVNETVLAEVAHEAELSVFLRLGRGELLSSDIKPRLVASALEALIGAVYKDGGFEPAQALIKALFKGRVETVDLTNLYQADYKTRYQEAIQEKKRVTPTYKVLKEEGPDHDKIFYVQVCVGQDLMAEGQGKSKKQAEQDAARKALEKLS